MKSFHAFNKKFISFKLHAVGKQKKIKLYLFKSKMHNLPTNLLGRRKCQNKYGNSLGSQKNKST